MLDVSIQIGSSSFFTTTGKEQISRSEWKSRPIPDVAVSPA